MSLAWFKKPTAEVEGTLNLTYNAVDRAVIAGRAGEPAVTGVDELDHAELLDQVARLAGALRWLGVPPGGLVGVRLDDPTKELLTLLAAARLGATFVDLDLAESAVVAQTRVVVTDATPEFAHALDAAILVGPQPVFEGRDVTWEEALKAGRTDPAGCEPVSPRATAYVISEQVAIEQVPERTDRLAQLLNTLIAGGPVTLDPTGAQR